MAILLLRRGLKPEYLPFILKADSSEADTLLAEAAKAPSGEKGTKSSFRPLYPLRDQFREHAAQAALPNIDQLKNAFLAKLKNIRIKKGTRKMKAKGLHDFVQKVETLDDAAPVIDRVCKSIRAQQACLRLLYPLIAVFYAKISTLAVDEETLSHQFTESLFNEEQIQRKAKKKKLFQDTFEFNAEEFFSEEAELKIIETTPAVSLPEQPASLWQNLHAKILGQKTIETGEQRRLHPQWPTFRSYACAMSHITSPCCAHKSS